MIAHFCAQQFEYERILAPIGTVKHDHTFLRTRCFLLKEGIHDLYHGRNDMMFRFEQYMKAGLQWLYVGILILNDKLYKRKRIFAVGGKAVAD